MDKKGFTLIELIASVTILAILALMAFPALLNMLNSGQEKVDDAVMRTVEAAAEEYMQNNNNYSTVTVCTLAKDGYITTNFYKKYKDTIGSGSVSSSVSGQKRVYTFSSSGGVSSCSLS